MKLLFPIVAAAVASAKHVSMEYHASAGLRGLPEGWKNNGPSPHDHKIELLFAVKQTNLDKLESTLMAVSDPDSPQYGKHLSNAAVHKLVAPEGNHIGAVKTFLMDHGVLPVGVTSNEDFIRADVTVKQAEAILSTKYYEMEHGSGRKVHRAMKYSLPEEVASALDFVSPTVHFPTPKKGGLKPNVEAPAPLVTNSPARLRELYSVGAVEGNATGNRMAVTGFLEQFYSLDDLNQFWDQFCDGIRCGKGPPKLVGDATTGSPAGVEAMLDIETITGVAGNIESEFWGFSDNAPGGSEQDPFLGWLTKMDITDDDVIPKIFSTSYGEDEDAMGLAGAKRLNAEFQKQGVRGISLLFASGDEGSNCKRGKYVPEAPASSPWVTAVGGTQSQGNSDVETGISLSSGGFSNRWAMPDWQQSAVDNYFKTASGLPQASKGYNTTGRAYPDISAQASNYDVIANGRNNRGVAGTSCASPAAAGIIALLNDARIAAGQPTLGFLNPFIYKNGDLWNDVTTGNNKGCNFGSGWPASAGWDAVTGYGTPNYEKLVAASLAAIK